MRILHFSDTHLGYQAFDVVNDAGINAREQDVYDAFERVIDQVIELRPDVVIHSGDFFHRPSPSNRALTVGLEQLRRVCNLQIPTIIIAGNHETPKTVFTSPILRAFRSLECVYSCFGNTYEVFEVGNIAIHGVPHINDLRLLQEELTRLEVIPGKFNILLLHTSLGKRYLMEEYGEQVFPVEFERKLRDFQYIALGHWHNYQQTDILPNAWYSGSLERLSDTEIGAEKGFIVLDILPDGTYTQTFHPIVSRPWLRVEVQQCHTKSVVEIRQELEQFRDRQDTTGAIITLNINEIKPEQSLEISNSHLQEIFPDAFQLLPKRRTFSDRTYVQNLEVNQFDSLDKLFAGYIREKYKDDEILAGQLVERANRYFEET